MVDSDHYISFILDYSLFFICYDELLGDEFQRKEFWVKFSTDEINSAKPFWFIKYLPCLCTAENRNQRGNSLRPVEFKNTFGFLQKGSKIRFALLIKESGLLF